MDSEHSMLTAAGAAAATGARVFTATSSQGLLYGFELLYTIAGWRVPMVLVNVSRALASPVTLEPDHNDVLAARDCGFLQIHAETCQEVLDSILMSYRVSEDPRVLLPVIVNSDGFYLSFTREAVELPDLEAVRRFLPVYHPSNAAFRASKPMAQAVTSICRVLPRIIIFWYSTPMGIICRILREPLTICRPRKQSKMSWSKTVATPIRNTRSS